MAKKTSSAFYMDENDLRCVTARGTCRFERSVCVRGHLLPSRKWMLGWWRRGCTFLENELRDDVWRKVVVPVFEFRQIIEEIVEWLSV
jgi:hypothetical protein